MKNHNTGISTDTDKQIPVQLSDRELQILQMICQGMETHEIAENLSLSIRAINSYRTRLWAKFDVKNDVQLSHIANKHGLMDWTAHHRKAS